MDSYINQLKSNISGLSFPSINSLKKKKEPIPVTQSSAAVSPVKNTKPTQSAPKATTISPSSAPVTYYSKTVPGYLADPIKYGYVNNVLKPQTSNPPVNQPPTPPAIPTPDTTPTKPTINTSGRDTAFNNYLTSLNPSSAENEARRKYLDFITGAESGINALEGKGSLLSITRGKQEKLRQQAETTAKRLQGDIELAQGDTESARKVAEAKYLFEQGLLDESSKAGESDNKLLSLDEATTLGLPYGTTVGEAKQLGIQVSPTPAKLDTSITDIGNKRVLVNNQTGKIITELGATPKSLSSSGGSNLDELLSISEARQLGVPYGTTRNQAIGKRSLSAAQQEASVSAGSALGALANLENDLSDGEGGFSQRKLVNFGLGKIATYEREIKDVLSRIRTGAALTSSEESFYAKQIPRAIDNDETIRAKINQLSAFYAGIAGTPVTLETTNGEILVADDMYDPETRLEVRNAITNGANVIKY